MNSNAKAGERAKAAGKAKKLQGLLQKENG
jgi:hypothetical protein